MPKTNDDLLKDYEERQDEPRPFICDPKQAAPYNRLTNTNTFKDVGCEVAHVTVTHEEYQSNLNEFMYLDGLSERNAEQTARYTELAAIFAEEEPPPAQHSKLVNLGTEGLDNADVIRHPDCPEGKVYYIPKFRAKVEPPKGDQIQWAQASSSVGISPSIPSEPEAFPSMVAHSSKFNEFMYLNGLGEHTEEQAKRHSELLKDFTDMLDSEDDEPKEPTLEEAVMVLNERKHRDRDNWAIIGADEEDEADKFYLTYPVEAEDTTSAIFKNHQYLTAFETVAIAEKYLREGKQ